MSSIVSDPNGRKRLLFFDPGGTRRTVRLGKVQMRHAESIRAKVDSLLSAAVTRQPPDRETSDWVAELADDLHAKLASAGLLKPRIGRTLGGWLTAFMAGRTGLKPESRRKLDQTKAKLLVFFGDGRQLHEITPDAAARWREDLSAKGLSEAAVKTHTGNAKTIMAEAVRRELIERSAFAALKGGVTPTRNTRYVTPADAEKVLAACPDGQWRLLVGLARLAGLRTPSEVAPLTWADVDWERGRLRVHSPKTERYPGHEQRYVPIVPRLMELLHEQFEAAAEGEEHIVTIQGIGGRHRRMRSIIDRAGVEPWDDTWQTLRRSCEIEWALSFPQFAVSRWIGHSITVSGRHYANAIPDDLFDRAAGHPNQNPSPVGQTAKTLDRSNAR
ncbi:MAG: tyrosine-type recombinase/integrase [Phycisphaerales bacterium]